MSKIQQISLGCFSMLLLGCSAIQGNKEPVTLDGINFAAKNGTCSKQCLDKYTSCVNTSNSIYAANCKSSASFCVGACPDAK